MNRSPKPRKISHDLDDNLLVYILRFANISDLLSVAQVSRSFRKAAMYVTNEAIEVVRNLHYSRYFTLPSRCSLELLKKLCKQEVFIIKGIVTYQLNLSTREWTRHTDTRRDRSHFAVAYLRNYIYAIGTSSLVAAGTVERYNRFRLSWENVEQLPKRLRYTAAAVMNHRIYVIGGKDSNTNENCRDIYCHNEDYEVNHKKVHMEFWQLCKCRIKLARACHAATSYMSCLWIGGGRLDGGAVTNTVEIYDTVEGEWKLGPSMIRNRVHGNLLVVDDVLYAVGGDVDEEDQKLTRTIEKFNVRDNAWEFVTTFKDERKGFSTCVVGHKIYVFGGSAASEIYNDTWDIFDTKSLMWESSRLPLSSHAYYRMPQIDDWGQAITVPPTGGYVNPHN